MLDPEDEMLAVNVSWQATSNTREARYGTERTPPWLTDLLDLKTDVTTSLAKLVRVRTPRAAVIASGALSAQQAAKLTAANLKDNEASTLRMLAAAQPTSIQGLRGTGERPSTLFTARRTARDLVLMGLISSDTVKDTILDVSVLALTDDGHRVMDHLGAAER